MDIKYLDSLGEKKTSIKKQMLGENYSITVNLVYIALTNRTYIALTYFAWSMVPLLDGNSEIVAHVRSNICYLIYLGHLIGSKEVTTQISFSEKTYP